MPQPPRPTLELVHTQTRNNPPLPASNAPVAAIPAPGPAPMITPTDPFVESALEEALADALERAAREAGIDLS